MNNVDEFVRFFGDAKALLCLPSFRFEWRQAFAILFDLLTQWFSDWNNRVFFKLWT